MCAGSTCGAAGGLACCATGVSTRGGAWTCACADAGAGACAIGVGTPGCGRAGSTAGSAAAVLIRCVICASRGNRCPGCTAIVTNRDNTSSAADSDAAEVCARNIDGSAFVGLVLAHAATMSPTAWCSSSAFRWIRSRFSRKARDTACSTAFGSCAIPGFWGLRLIASAFSYSTRLFPTGAKPRFVIVVANLFRVNHLPVPMCPIVAYLPGVRHRIWPPPSIRLYPKEVTHFPPAKNAKIPSGGDTVSTEAVAARRHAGTHLPVTWWKLEMPTTTWHLLLN